MSDALNKAAQDDGADGVINEGIEGVSKTKFLMDANESSDLNSDYKKYGNNS